MGRARAPALALVTVAASAAFAATAAHGAPARGFAHLDIDATLDPGTQRLEASVTVRLDAAPRSDPDGNARVRMLLHSNLEPSAITDGNTPLDWRAHQGFDPKHFWERPDYGSLGAWDHLREIEIDAPPEGWPETANVKLVYAGSIDDSLHAPEEDYGRSFEETAGLIEARGAYLAPSTGWVPFVPGDLVTFTLDARVPSAWEAISQGQVVANEIDDGRRSVSFDCPYPMDGIHLVAGPWIVRDDTHGETQILTYTYAQDDALTGTYIDATKRYLTRYEREIGPYPFSKFALVENFWETGYGMPSFTLLGSTVIRLPFIVDTSYGHEILHCWWGNGVFVDPLGGNWCEGLTSFMADHAYELEKSPRAARDYRRNQLTAYLNYVSAGRDLPLSAFRERHSGATQAIGYGKSLMVFHMLRTRIGEKAWRDGIGSFYEEHRHRSASWDDLIGAFESASGEELGWFAEQWVRRSGAPSLRVTGVEVLPGEGAVVAGVIEQTEPIYRLDVPLLVTTLAGDTTRAVVACEGPGTPFRIEVPLAPDELRVDPDFDLFRRLHREEIPPVLSQTMGADSLVIIVTDRGDETLRTRYKELAERWSRRPGARVVHERDLLDDPGAVRDRVRNASVWLFGEVPLAAHAMARASEAASELPALVAEATGSPAVPPAGYSLVVTVTHPWNRSLSWSWLSLADAEVAEAIGRKVPHYGKYSYLLFEGTSNVAKGTWARSASPLRIDLRSLTPPSVEGGAHG